MKELELLGKHCRDNMRTQAESLAAAGAMTSEERIRALSDFSVDNDILTVEIEHRTGISQRVAEIVTVYELLHSRKILYLQDLAEEIGGIDVATEVETEGIEQIDAETALQVLLAEEEIYHECGISC